LQSSCDLTKSHVGRHQQFARDLEADFVGDLTECNAIRPQVSVQSASMHREKAGDRGSRTAVPEQLGAKHFSQFVDEGNGVPACLRVIGVAGKLHFHRSSPSRRPAAE
jgi:hypothetical protein